jgi:hypothetical protein
MQHNEYVSVSTPRREEFALGGGRATHDKVRHDELNVDPELLCLLSQRLGPSLEEGFATGVGGEHGGGDESGERADGEDKAAFAGEHRGEEELGREEGGFDVLNADKLDGLS